MERLVEYLNRSSRKVINYLDSEDSLNDSELVKDWLAQNIRYKLPTTGMSESEQIDLGHPSYILGKYDPDNMMSWFVAVSDGKSFVIRIRTTDNYNRHGFAPEKYLLLQTIQIGSRLKFKHSEISAQEALDYLQRAADAVK